MDKISEYIPLLIILASFAISILGKKKKQGKITQKTTLPGKTVEDFFDFEEEESSQSYSETFQTLSEDEPKKKSTNNNNFILEKKASSFSSAPLMLESEEEHSNFSFEDEEDVKKAIIYSEIINRKEY